MPISSLFCFHLASLFLFGFFSISIFLSGSGQAEERLVTAPGPEGHLAGIYHAGAAISEGKKIRLWSLSCLARDLPIKMATALWG